MVKSTMKKEVELCDICEEMVSVGKCAVCGKHVCRQHGYLVVVESDKYVALKLKFINPIPKRKMDMEIEENILCKNCFVKITNELGNLSGEEELELGSKIMKAILEFLVAKGV